MYILWQEFVICIDIINMSIKSAGFYRFRTSNLLPRITKSKFFDLKQNNIFFSAQISLLKLKGLRGHTMVFLLWFCSVIHFCPTRCIYMKYTYMYMYYFSNFVNCPSRCLIYMILPFSMLIFFWFCPSRCLIYMILPFSMLNFFVFAYASWRAKMEKYKY